MPILYTIDRFEGVDWAVLEDCDARAFSIPTAWLPVGAREGDVLSARLERLEGSGTIHFELAPEAKALRLRDAERRRQKLPSGPKGDVTL
jgi:hypothetical protein